MCWAAQWLLGWIYLDLFSTFFGIFYNRDGLGPSSVEYILGKKKIIHQNNNAIQLIYQNKRTPPTINEKERKIIPKDRKSTRLNSSHESTSRMPSSA